MSPNTNVNKKLFKKRMRLILLKTDFVLIFYNTFFDYKNHSFPNKFKSHNNNKTIFRSSLNFRFLKHSSKRNIKSRFILMAFH